MAHGNLPAGEVVSVPLTLADGPAGHAGKKCGGKWTWPTRGNHEEQGEKGEDNTKKTMT